MGKSQNLYKVAKKMIPAGTQLLSKRPEMFLPELWPAYYQKAQGCYVWDLDGNKYIDMCSMGIGSCILGYGDKDVDAAVKKVINKGTMSVLNPPEEVELAGLLLRMHPWAEMVRYARTGGEAMAVAVRIARAGTAKDRVLFCGYHGWHDWYLSANIAHDKLLDGHLLPGLEPRGVPRALKGSAIPFTYNDTDGFLRLMRRYRERIAAVVMEPIRNYFPKKGFLEKIREVTAKSGIILIFDEVSSGWKMAPGGAHLRFKVYPDICVFAKAISNGYPMAAIIGRKKIMQAAQGTFISSTYWTERMGPAAALATIRKLKAKNAPIYLAKAGKKIQQGWEKSAKKYGLDISITGTPASGHFYFNYHEPLILKTIFTQEMLGRGFLATTDFKASLAHKETHIKKYLNAVDGVFGFIARAIKEGSPGKYLKGPVCHSGFKRLA